MTRVPVLPLAIARVEMAETISHRGSPGVYFPGGKEENTGTARPPDDRSGAGRTTVAKANGAKAKATKATGKATATQIAAERTRANALAKRYGGKPELLTLAEAQREHPNLILKAEDMANPAYFHLRFRPCSICGRFPAQATRHLALHESGALDAAGHVTDAKRRKAIEVRVAKAVKTIAAERKPKAKKTKKAKAA